MTRMLQRTAKEFGEGLKINLRIEILTWDNGNHMRYDLVNDGVVLGSSTDGADMLSWLRGWQVGYTNGWAARYANRSRKVAAQ